MLAEQNKKGSLFEDLLEQQGFGDALEADFYSRITGLEYRNWLYFIELKATASTLSNSYLRFVLENTSHFDDFKGNVLNAIVDVPHPDNLFDTFCSDRKMLVSKIPRIRYC